MSRLALHLGHHDGWSPYRLPRSIFNAWWCADDHGIALLMTDDGAGLISSWTDRIGKLAITAATSARPTYGAAVFNSAYAGLTHDGIANCLVSTTLTTLPTSSTAGWAMVLVSSTSVAALAQIMTYGGTANGTLRSLRQTSGNSGQASDGTTGTAGPANVFVGAHMLYGDWSGTAENCYVDGTIAASSPATIGSLNTGTTRIRLGASNGTSAANFYNGIVRHCLIGTGTLSTANRQRLEGWLAWDSNLTSVLPSSHPYKLVRP